MTKKVAYVYESKKGNLVFNIGDKTYIIIDRNPQEIGQNDKGKISYAKKILLESK